VDTILIILYRETIALLSEIHTKHVNTVWAERRIIEYETCGTYSDHRDVKSEIYVVYTSQLMLYIEIIAV